jgi:tRNA pseudouridine(38-40) synthase
VPAALTVAGRTDAGVHATGQVAHLDVPRHALAPGDLARRLNRLLPVDLRVPAVRQVPPATPGSPRCGGATATGSATRRGASIR